MKIQVTFEKKISYYILTFSSCFWFWVLEFILIGIFLFYTVNHFVDIPVDIWLLVCIKKVNLKAVFEYLVISRFLGKFQN